MGLSTILTDINTNSIPILLLAAAAAFLSSLLSLLHPTTTTTTLQTQNTIPSKHLISTTLFSYTATTSDQDCVFCLCGFESGETLRRLPCRHVFHQGCVDGWFDRRNRLFCPLCRSEVIAGVDGWLSLE